MFWALKFGKSMLLVLFFAVTVILPCLESEYCADGSVIRAQNTQSFPVQALGVGAGQVFGVLTEPERHDIQVTFKYLISFMYPGLPETCSGDPGLDYERHYLGPVARLWLIHGSLLC